MPDNSLKILLSAVNGTHETKSNPKSGRRSASIDQHSPSAGNAFQLFLGGKGGSARAFLYPWEDNDLRSEVEQLLKPLLNKPGALQAVMAELVLRASKEERLQLAALALPAQRDLIADLVAAEDEMMRRDAEAPLLPALPALPSEELPKIARVAKRHPWANRDKDDVRDPFEWVRDHYGQWVGKGLLQRHIAIDRPLYNAFKQRERRLGRPDWLDVPHKGEAVLRGAATPDERLNIFAARRLQGNRNRMLRAPKA